MTPIQVALQPPGPIVGIDLANADLFASTFADRLRFCTDIRAWMQWDESHWELAHESVAFQHARELALTGANVRMHSAAGMKQMLSLAKNDERLTVTSSAFDANPWLLTVRNGILDLRSGRLHGSGDRPLVRKLAGTEFVQGARCPSRVLKNC